MTTAVPALAPVATGPAPPPPITYMLAFTIFLNDKQARRDNKLDCTAALNWSEEEASYKAWIRQDVGADRWREMRLVRERITAIIQTVVNNKKTSHFDQDIRAVQDWQKVVRYLELHALRGTIQVVVDARYKDLNHDPASEPATAPKPRTTTTTRKLQDTANRQAAARACGENPNQQIAEKWVCQSVSCPNYHKVCWVTKGDHYPLVSDDIMRWAQLWNRGEEGVNVDRPPQEVAVEIVSRKHLAAQWW